MKVPFILAFMTGTWVSYTPPQPPPEENEKMEWTDGVDSRWSRR